MNSLTKQSWWRVPANLAVRLQSSASQNDEIQIPERIERSSTDILRALAFTVPKIQNTKPYQFQCDPYLHPLTNRQRREMALSKESGRKTALWVKGQHKVLFPPDSSQPVIPLYSQPDKYAGTEKMTEKYLIKLISESQHQNALELYTMLKEEDVSTETKLSLFELLCFHAGGDVNPAVELQVDKWYTRTMESYKNTFVYSDAMKRLFELLIQQDEKTASHAYSALICGAALHCDGELAHSMYDHCVREKIPLACVAYNSMLSVTWWLHRFPTPCIKAMQQICTIMSSNGVKANIHTYNAILKSATNFTQTQIAFTVCKSIFQEIRKAGLEPTLATYSYMLTIFNRDDRACRDEIREVLMMSATKKEYTPSHPDDLTFFGNAMRANSRLLADRELGELIHETLLTGQNYKLIGSTYEEIAYYRSFMLLVLQTSKFEKFEEFYDRITPNVYQPETIVFEKILDALQVQPAAIARKYCLKHWHDLMTYYPRQSQATSNRLLFLMSTKCDLPNDSPLHEEFSKAAWDMWMHMQQRNVGKFTMKQIRFTADMLSDILVLLLRSGKYEQLATVLTFMNKHSSLIEGVMLTEKVDEIFTKCLAEGDSQIVFLILDYVMQNDIPGLHVMVKKVRATLILNTIEEAKLAQMITPHMDPVSYQLHQQEEATQV